jgi:membrane-associated protease RseP (regulator of RpoE activity)
MNTASQGFVPNVQPNVPQGAAFVVDPSTGQLFLQFPPGFQQPSFQQGTFQQPTAGVPTRFGFSTQGATQDTFRNAYTPLNRPMPNVQPSGTPTGTLSGTPAGTASLAGRVTLESAFRDIRQGTVSQQLGSRFGLVFDTTAPDALRVGSVGATSIAAGAGLRRGDEIVTIDGRQFATPERALNYLDTRLESGAAAEITLVRDGREIELVASSRPSGDGRRLVLSPRRRASGDSQGRAALGVTFDDRAVNFVHVWRVAPNSPAEHVGLRHGDHIVSINGQQMTTYKDVLSYLAGRRPGDPVDLVILRNGGQMRLEGTLGSTDEAFTAERRPVSRRRI